MTSNTKRNSITFNFHGKRYKPWQIEFWTTLLIRLKTNDYYYHVSLTINNTNHFEALCCEGVVNPTQLKTDPTYKIRFNVEDNDNFEKFITILENQVGKPYDWLAVLLGFFGIKISDKNKWYCNELAYIFYDVYFPSLKNRLKTNLSPKSFRLLTEGLKAGVQSNKVIK